MLCWEVSSTGLLVSSAGLLVSSTLIGSEWLWTGRYVALFCEVSSTGLLVSSTGL